MTDLTVTAIVPAAGLSSRMKEFKPLIKIGGQTHAVLKRELEDENRRLKQLVAEQSLDIRALKAALGKKW